MQMISMIIRSYILNCGERYKDIIDHRSYLHILSKLPPEKNSDLNGIRTHDLCDVGAVLYQLSYLSCVHICRDDQSSLHIALRISNIGSFTCSFAFFITYRYITNSQCDQHLVGLIAEFGRALVCFIYPNRRLEKRRNG